MNMLRNAFDNLAWDLTLRNLIRKIMGFSFDSTSQLRVWWTVALWGWTVWTVTNVTTMATWNIWLWDMWKNATAQNMSMNTFYSSVWRNFVRT